MLLKERKVSERRSCQLVRISRPGFRYQSRRSDALLVEKLKAIRVKELLKQKGIQTLYIEPGSPWQNARGESFNGRLRDECLNVEWVRNLREAGAVIESWRCHYNEARPHSSLDYRTPSEFYEVYKQRAMTLTTTRI